MRYELPPKVGECLGENLRACREQTGLSQTHLAHLAATHRTHIGKLEAGERVYRVDTLIKLASSLGVPVALLLDRLEWVAPTPAKDPGEKEMSGHFLVIPSPSDSRGSSQP
jgi:transcriptional regulator with XRE-family HTH domain